MDYIILDLEWNQCPDGKKRENPALPFEIIEIGAVRLNEKLQLVDQFHEIVTPKVYRHLHWRTKSVIHLRDKDLQGHASFPEAASAFFRWCGHTYGEDYILCTWGPADLPELERNLSFYASSMTLSNPFPFPLLYLDAQKIFGLTYEGQKTTRSLEYAIDFLKMEKHEAFHGALSDAHYTARVVSTFSPEDLSTWYSMDYYRLPACRDEEVLLSFPTYSKYVSRPFADKEALQSDKGVSSSICIHCGRRCRRKIHWFQSGSRTLLSLAYCPDHGYLKGKIRLRNHPNGSVYAIKTQKSIDEEGARLIREKKKASVKRKKSVKK